MTKIVKNVQMVKSGQKLSKKFKWLKGVKMVKIGRKWSEKSKKTWQNFSELSKMVKERRQKWSKQILEWSKL